MRGRTLRLIPILTLVAFTLGAGLAGAQGPARISAIDAAPSAPVGGFTCPNGGTLLINQQPDQSNGIFADSDCDLCGTGSQSVAGDFILPAATTVAQLVFWGGYFPDNQIPMPPDAINVIFHQDTPGLPGTVIDTQNLVPTSATQTGVVLFGVNEVLYVVDLTPVALPAGTFWIEIFTNSVGNTDQFFWEVGTLDAVNGRDGTAFSTTTPGATWTGTPDQDFAYALCSPGAVDSDLSTTKTATVNPDDTVDFEITVTNNGPDPASNVVVTDPLPPCTTYISDDCGGMVVPPWTWNVGSIPVNGSETCTITVDASGCQGQQTNTATATADQADPNPGDESGTATFSLAGVLEIPTLGRLGVLALIALLIGFGVWRLRTS